MFCSNCGKEVKGNFCGACGTKVVESTVQEENSTTKVEENSNRNVVLTVTRVKKILGFAISFSVYVDDVQIGSLGNGKSITCNVSEGNHKVIFKCVEKEVVQEINVLSTTNSVEVVCHAKMGLVAAVASIDEVKYN